MSFADYLDKHGKLDQFYQAVEAFSEPMFEDSYLLILIEEYAAHKASEAKSATIELISNILKKEIDVHRDPTL
jgi:hypothetical protein